MWLIVVLVLVVAGLEWNRRRELLPRDLRTGRTGVQDRDFERLLDELRAAADRKT